MTTRSAFPLVCLASLCGLPACGVINNVAAGLDARSRYPDTYETTQETGREVLATDFADHRARDLVVSAEGLQVSVQAQAICSEEIYYRDMFAARGASPLLPPDMDWPVGLAAGIGADLVVGGIVVGATGFAAHLNRSGTPAEWDTRRSLVLKGVGAVVAVDLVSTAWVLTGLRTHAPRTEHVAQPCSDWDTAPRTTPAPSVAVEGHDGWGSQPIEDLYAVFSVSADLLGRVLIPERGPLPATPTSLDVVVQGPGANSLAVTVPSYIRGTDYEPPWTTMMKVSAETVAEHTAAWRCATVGTSWAEQRLAQWTPGDEVELMDSLAETCPETVEEERFRMCERSTALADHDAWTWLEDRPGQIETLVHRCEQGALWQERADGLVAQGLEARQPPRLLRLELAYGELFGDPWTEGVTAERRALSRELDVATFEALMEARREGDSEPLLQGLTLLDDGTDHLSSSWASARRREIKSLATADVKATTRDKSFSSARHVIRRLGEPLGESWTRQMTAHVDSRERQHVAAEEARAKAEYRRCVNLCKRVRIAGDRTSWVCRQAYNPSYCVYYQPSQNSCDYGLRGETIMYEPNMPIEMAAQIVVGCKN